MKATQQIFEYLTAFAVVVLFSSVILFFPEMGQDKQLPSDVSGMSSSGTEAQPQEPVPAQTGMEGGTHG
ncbi:hypothetical protein [Noviherbaspirillum aerium]|uniref:hypothetical protein n=1 Tax=Noviherbaspirillum aerium TaxID=2588497 RepID=UPI00124D1452|nr:hypothetical protein [Noviherbaspirillum aerium]